MKKTADVNKIATKVLAILLVENKKMDLLSIVRAYNKVNDEEQETIDTLFNNAITYLLADGLIEEIKEEHCTYKVTLKAKLMTR